MRRGLEGSELPTEHTEDSEFSNERSSESIEDRFRVFSVFRGRHLIPEIPFRVFRVFRGESLLIRVDS